MAKKDYVRYINSLLRKNTEQSKQELLELFADKEFRKRYVRRYQTGIYVYSDMYISGRKGCTY